MVCSLHTLAIRKKAAKRLFSRINHHLYYKVPETPGVVRYIFFDGKPTVARARNEEIKTLS